MAQLTAASTTGGTHRLVPSPAGRTHVVEQGSGPLVLLVHGFPESWYSWRHQLPALAAAGYRAVAMDVRGYGRSSRPTEIGAYRLHELIEDTLAVVEGLGESSAVIVGHDWGATIAANSALLHPEVFRAVGLLSVPYAPWTGPRPSEIFAQMGGDGEFYVSYFQEPGRAEGEVEPDIRGWLAGFYAGLSADTMSSDDKSSFYFVRPGGKLSDGFPVGRRPSWLTDGVLDAYAAEFERTGLTGGLNRYRNMDRDWEEFADWRGAPLPQPSLFIGGSEDASIGWLSDVIAAFPTTLPGLVGSHILPGSGHWIQQEASDEVNTLLLDWLAGL
ncbi:alpha/beta hydrolase [Streptomyces sp. NPDC047315]|uniref:alpha/beta fold hydrolase n=1 Tax=Streptomyces sp. NPDC047315 TaxID=3155142 RepID=UPI00340C85C9